MLSHYFKIAWRNLAKGKIYSLINITGLAVGMTVAMLIGLWIWDEISFDSYFENHHQLVQVMLNQTNEGIIYTGEVIAPPIADPLRTQYGSSFKALSLVSFSGNHIFKLGDNILSSQGIWVEPNFPKMFTLKMLFGSGEALQDPSTILLSQSLASALFGDENPLNKTLLIDNQQEMVVGGVYEDFPRNTTFYDTKLLLPWANQANFLNTVTDWKNHSCRLFAQLSDNAEIQALNEKIKSLPTPHIEEWKEEIMLYQLDKLYLQGEFENGEVVGGRIRFIILFGTIGVFVILLACVNFMNLSTARSEKRAKEVGICKTVGSGRRQLINQFLTESTMVAAIAVVFAFILTLASIPSFNTLADKNLSIPWENPWFWLVTLGFAIISGIISGSYPAFYLSSFMPVKVLKGTFKAGQQAVFSRRMLVVFQFTVSITLIIGTLVVFKQIQFAKDRPAGYNRSGLISVFANTPEMRQHSEAIQYDLLQTGVVDHVAESSQSAAHFSNNTTIEWPGKDSQSSMVFFRNVNVTADFGKTIGWTIKEGRDFSSTLASDSQAVLFNETAIRIMGMQDPLDEAIRYNDRTYNIIGIVNDMVTQSPYSPIEPTVFFMDGFTTVFNLRLRQNMSDSDALARIEDVFKKYNPHAPFEFSYVDESFERKYSNEKQIGNLASLFTVLAIFISLLGLGGLASFVAEQRTKEIGIRKVLGASIIDLWKMLSRDFLLLVTLSSLIAIPIAYYFLKDWLQQYEYRTAISWWVFAAAGAGAIFLTLFTVSFQTIKAALTNPAKSLRSQ